MSERDLLRAADHDLRSPIRRIATFAEIVERDLGPDVSEDTRHALAVIRSNARRARGVIDALALLNQVQRAELSLADVPLADLVREAWAEQAQAFGAHGVSLTGSELGTLRLHRRWWPFALECVLDNALRYGGAVRQVQVTWRSDVEQLIVEDDGIGVQPRFREQAMRPFGRLHAWHEIEGHGLGLALCAALAELQGGSLGLDESPLGGLSVVLHLPQGG